MAINLEKGQVINLSKESGINLSKGVIFGLGFAAKSGTVDLDSWVSVIDANDKCIDFICFSNLRGQGIKHNGDDLVGGGKESEPNETIEINFSNLKEGATKLIVGNSIYSGARNLGNLKYAFTTLTQNGSEVARYNMKDNYGNSSTVVVGEFRLSGGEWKFKALGRGESHDYQGAKRTYGNRGTSIGRVTANESTSSRPTSNETEPIRNTTELPNSGGGFLGAIKRIFS